MSRPASRNGIPTRTGTPVAVPATSLSTLHTANPELDVAKLQSMPAEQQELYMLQFVSALTKHVESLSADDCTAQQFYLKKEVFRIINLPSPQPSRVIRSNLGRCMARVFGMGDRKLLFETVNDLVGIITGSKSKSDVDKTRARHAAVSCLGDVYAAAGDSAIGLHLLSCSALLKALKSSTSNAGLRAAALKSLGKIAGMVGTSMDEAVSRDIWKQSRSLAAGDKTFLVVVSALRCLRALVRSTRYFATVGDFESFKGTMWKIIDSPSVQVRHTAAECIAEVMMAGHVELPIGDGLATRSKKAKKAPKRSNTMQSVGAEEDEMPSRSSSPAPGGTRKSSELALTLVDMLKILSTQYVKASTTNRGRATIGVCYSKLLARFGETMIETNYMRIVDNLTVDILGQPSITNNRYRMLISRRIVDTIIQEVVGGRVLGETGQTAAAKSLINDVLRYYPQTLPERPEPSKHTLIAALGAIASLVDALGSAANNFADACRDGLLQVLQHPSYSVQVHASSCMKKFVLACPQQLLPCLSVCMNSLSRELNLLATGRNSPRRCVGFAHGLAAALSASPSRPLHGSVDVNSRVLTMATNLLKSSGQAELRVATTQIQVAWILIGGLMSLGPNFVKIHLSQLLLLWKNALPKPLAKENHSSRGYLEASFLAHVRECALGSILAFLQFNARLLTVDVSKRIATMLQNTTAFLKTLPAKKTTDDIAQRLTPALQLYDLDMMVQRRVLQCYVKLVNLSPAGGSESLLQSNLLTLALPAFSDPDNYSPTSLGTSIANAAQTFESIWDVGDNIGSGVTGLVSGFNFRPLPGQHLNTESRNVTEASTPEDKIDRVLLSPVCGSLEHDASLLYIGCEADGCSPDPAATEVVNMAIQLFAFVFPQTPPKVQESVLEQIKTFASAGLLQRDPGRKAAITVNLGAVMLATLRVAGKETPSPSGNVTSDVAVETLLRDMLRDLEINPDPYVRNLACSAIALLCSISGGGLTNHEIKYLVDTIIINREPHARAGCAMALGAIQSKVGGMSAGSHLKTILGILMSLCNDPHPTVHYWALEALSVAADAASLSFSPYVSGTLAMLAQLYLSDTHHPEMASTSSATAATANMEMDLSTTAAIARGVDSLINVLGPDLQDSTKSRELIFSMVGQFQEEDTIVQKEALVCLEHLSLYAPGYVPFNDYVRLLQRYLGADQPTVLRDIAVDGLHNMMKRNPQEILDAAEKGLEDQLWLILDTMPTHDGTRNIIRNWLRQTCLEETTAWLQRFQHVFKMTRSRQKEESSSAAHTSAMPDLQDEEVAGFAASNGAAKDEKDAATASPSDSEPLRWQVTTFACDCLNDIFIIVTKDIATNGESRAQAALQHKVADIVRLAFSASTSSVLELRVWGLKIIGAVLRMFGKTPDPDFEEAMLLEQYQAQISSALTPAFAADSSPELAAEAVTVCADFIATGIVTDVDRMGRILKTLVNALESFSKETENASIGDLKGLSANARVMVKMSIFAAWAELQVASPEQRYLVDVLKPHIGTLTPLWLDSLREFARLRFEPDISMTLGPPSLSGSLDTIYAALNRETLLTFYQDSWLKLVDAIASLIEQDGEFVFDALDGKEADTHSTADSSKGPDINYRDEPVAFFFVLFGLAFEALATRPGSTDSLASSRQTLAILKALKKILHPSVSGLAIYRDAIFTETMDLLDRLALTDGLDIQSVIVDIARALCIAHPSAREQHDEDTDLSEDIEQLFELTRIIVLVLSGLLPNMAEANQPQRYQMTEEAILLVRNGLDALVDAAEVFPSVIKTDLHACIVHIFATILVTPSCQEIVAPQALPTLKRFVASMIKSRRLGPDGVATVDVQLQGCLRRFLSIYLNAQKREAPTSLTCVRNCLLASTFLFLGGQNELAATDGLVARYLDEVLDCLADRMTAKIAAGCIRSLLTQSQAPTVADLTIARYLVPRLLAFVTNTEPEDPEHARALVAHTLTQYAAVVPKPRAPVAISLVLPALMARAAAEGDEAVYRETSARLLELAAVDHDAFRAVVAGLSEGQKAFLEDVVKKGRGGQDEGGKGARRDDEGPSIELKMNFGG